MICPKIPKVIKNVMVSKPMQNKILIVIDPIHVRIIFGEVLSFPN